MKAKQNVADHELRGMFSYNVLDNPDYMNSKVIEKKIIRYYEKKLNRDQD